MSICHRGSGRARCLTFGFAPQMKGIEEDIAGSDAFTAEQKKTISDRLARKAARYAVKGNAWQNVFPTNIRAYQDWWAKVQAA